jgi:hypothetical protein
MQREQNYATHKRYYPLFHFVALPLLGLNLLASLVYAIRHYGAKMNWWNVVVAFALICLAVATRSMILTVQTRVIRLEETLRMQRVLPDDLRARIGELRTRQIIGLRFCSDEELPDLCRAVLNGEVRDLDEIKRRVKRWRPDYHRA